MKLVLHCYLSRFQENELRAKVLEEEKQIISQNSNQLLSSLNVSLMNTVGLSHHQHPKPYTIHAQFINQTAVMLMSPRAHLCLQLKAGQWISGPKFSGFFI